MTEKLAAAEAALKALEAPRHERELANVRYWRAVRDPEPNEELIARLKAELEAKTKAEEDAKISQRDIDKAAEAVLAAREEAGV